MSVSAIAGTTGHGVDPALPTGAGDDPTDYLVLGVGNHTDPGTATTFSVGGWSKLSEDNVQLAPTRFYTVAIFVAPATAGAPSITANNGGWVAALGAYRGVDLADPVTGPGALMQDSGGLSRFLPSPGNAVTGSAIVGVLMVSDNTTAPAWGGNPPNEPAGTSIASIQEVTGANSSIHQGYRAGIEGEEPTLWVVGSVPFEPEPPVNELEFRVAWGVVDQGMGRALLLRPA